MATNTSVNLDFKYGKEDSSLPMSGSTPDLTPGRVYIKKTKAGRAQMFIDTPEPSNSERLQLGGDVYVGKSSDPAAKNYDVIIDPNGETIDNVVTSVQPGGFQLKIEKATGNVDTYIPSTQGLSGNTIIFVVE